jgi:outer membrane immunogenic protein
MKRFLIAAAGVVAFAAPALAADMAPAPRAYTKAPPIVAAVYDWSGFYIGANGGWGQANRDPHITVAGIDVDLGRDSGNGGGTVGGQVGYRWQASSWVFGVEAQGNWADITGSHTLTVFGVPIPGVVGRSRLDAFGLFTGQVGYAWNNALFYVKGGFAVTDNRFDVDVLGVNVLTSNNQTRTGGTVGAGFEYGFTPNWSVAVEYDHLFEGNNNANFSTVPGGVFVGTANIRGDVDLVTARINYRFGGPVVARY